jgi:hypothetical protein
MREVIWPRRSWAQWVYRHLFKLEKQEVVETPDPDAIKYEASDYNYFRDV